MSSSFHLPAPDRQMGCMDLHKMIQYQHIAPSNGRYATWALQANDILPYL